MRLILMTIIESDQSPFHDWGVDFDRKIQQEISYDFFQRVSWKIDEAVEDPIGYPLWANLFALIK